MSEATRNTTRPRPAVLAATIAPLAIAAVAGLSWWWNRPEVTIGVEGRRVVEVAGPRLTAAPFTPGDAVSLRVAAAEPTRHGFRYDLRYILYGPGEHDLRIALRDADGATPANLSELNVSVGSVLPAKHGGELFAAPASSIDLRSRYSATMRALWFLWALLLIPLVLYGRRKRAAVEKPEPPPTVARRLQALLERAAVERPSAAEQVEIEQLLTAYWSQRLQLDGARLSDAVARLRSDPQSGGQFANVERWLHRRVTPANGEVARVLLGELAATSPSEFRRRGDDAGIRTTPAGGAIR